MDDDKFADIEAATGEQPAGEKPAFSSQNAAAWVNEGGNGHYLTVRIATGSFHLFPNTEKAAKALEYLMQEDEPGE
ncbi:MAG: hypothetical protein SVW02_02950 [Candidatus Nanohaloarchaea archaeon]|nr:hypothetical protein [Candidatus Nanohaloarchaea archaeon]